MQKPYVVVAGNIGVGKASAVEALSQELGLPAVSLSHQDNPFLDRFYADRNRWAFHSQAYFLQQGLAQHRNIKEHGGVQDQSVHEHFLVFAHQLRDEGVLSSDEFALLSGIYYGTQSMIEAPDLLVVLDAKPENLLQRAIAQNGSEQHITLEYLRALNKRYQDFADSWLASPVLMVDWNQHQLDMPSGSDSLVDMVLSQLG